MPILIILHSVFWLVYAGLRAYTIGIWFLIRHPIRFIGFVELWEGYEQSIADIDAQRAAGYFNLNREQRRRL